MSTTPTPSQIIPSSFQTHGLTYGVLGDAETVLGYCCGDSVIILDESLSVISIIDRLTQRTLKEETQDDEEEFSIETSIEMWKKRHVQTQSQELKKAYIQTIKEFKKLTSKEIFADSKFQARALAFGPHGQLAAVFGSDVIIFHATRHQSRLYWERTCCLRHAWDVTCVSWEPWGRQILVGGDRLQLWELGSLHGERRDVGFIAKSQQGVSNSLNFVRWESSLGSRLVACRFSPFGQYFVTVGAFDRLVKVWSKASSSSASGEESDVWRFIYLPHPTSVKSVVWRSKDLQRSSHKLNVLLTVCHNNVIRLWMESERGERLQFSVCSIIEPGEGTVADFINNPFLDFPSVPPPSPQQQQEDQLARFNMPQMNTSRHSKTLPDPNPSTDWIASIQENGIVIIWKVRGLADSPKHSSSASIWCRLSVVEALKGKQLNLIALSSKMTQGGDFPKFFSLFNLKDNGHISFFHCAQESSINPRIIPVLKAVCAGHSATIQQIETHPANNYCLTRDANNQVAVWSVNDSLFPSRNLFTQIASLSDVTHATWLDNPQLIILATQDGIKLSRVVSDQVSQFGILADSSGLKLEGLTYIAIKNAVVVVALTASGLMGWDLSRETFSDKVASKPIGKRFQLDIANFTECVVAPLPDFHNELAQGQVRFITGNKQGSVTFWNVKAKETPLTQDQPQLSPSSATSGTTLSISNDQMNISESVNNTNISTTTNRSASPESDNSTNVKKITNPNTSAASVPPKLTSEGEGELIVLDDISFAKVADFQTFTSQDPVSVVYPTSLGCLAIGSKSSGQLIIAQLRDSKLEIQHTIKEDPLHISLAAAWLPLFQGSSALAVACGDKILIAVNRSTPTATKSGSVWTHIELGHSFSAPVAAVGWSPTGNLIVGAGAQLNVFPKTEPLPDPIGVLGTRDVAFASLPQQLCEAFKGLPYFHPRVLESLLVSEEYDLVGSILTKLLITLRKAAQETDPDQERDPNADPHREEDMFALATSDVKVVAVPMMELSTLLHDKEAAPESEGSNNNNNNNDSDNNNNSTSSANLSGGSTSHGLFGVGQRASGFSMFGNAAAVPAASNRYAFLQTNTTQQASNITKAVGSAIFSDQQEDSFSSQDSKELQELLAASPLPGVASTSQMHLLAIIDTFDKMQQSRRSMDSCAVKFLLAFKVQAFLAKTSLARASSLALTSTDWAWAMHSETEDQLVQEALPADATWVLAKGLGLSFWVSNPTLLRTITEQIAKNEFAKSDKNPWSCFLLYMALRKKPAVVQLFKAVGNMTLFDFLSHDFDEPKWRNGALKNAYACMSTHRYTDAAGFFLLANDLRSACDVITSNSKDLQLALLIARVYEGDVGPVSQAILKETVLPQAVKEGDNALESIVHWHLRKYSEAVSALVHFKEEHGKVYHKDSNSSGSVLQLFKFLKHHTMLRNTQLKLDDVLVSLLKQSAGTFLDSGNIWMALRLLKELVSKIKRKAAKAASPSAEKKEEATSSPSTASSNTSNTAASLFGRPTQPAASPFGGGGFGRPTFGRVGFGGFNTAALFQAPPEEKKDAQENVAEWLDEDVVLRSALQLLAGLMENLSLGKLIPPVPEKEGKQDTKKEGKQDTEKEDKQDTEKEDKQDTKKEGKQDTEKESKQDTKKESKQDTKKEGTQDTEKEGKQDIKKEGKQDTKKESTQDTEKEGKQDIKKEGKQDTEKESKQPAQTRKEGETDKPYLRTVFDDLEKLLQLDARDKKFLHKELLQYSLTGKFLRAPSALFAQTEFHGHLLEESSKAISSVSKVNFATLRPEDLTHLASFVAQFAFIFKEEEQRKEKLIEATMAKQCLCSCNVAVLAISLVKTHYKAISLLTSSPFVALKEYFVPKDEEEIPLDYGREEPTKDRFYGAAQIQKFEVNGETEEWLGTFFQCAVLHWFIKLNEKYDAFGVNENLRKQALQYEALLVDLPEAIQGSSTKGWLWTGPQDWLPLVAKYMQQSRLFLDTANFRELWALLEKDSHLRSAIASIPFNCRRPEEKETTSKRNWESPGHIVFSDKDILQAFCINSANKSQFAISTTKSIREIMIDFNSSSSAPLPRSASSNSLRSSGDEAQSPRQKSRTPLSPSALSKMVINTDLIPFGKTPTHEYLITKSIDRDFVTVTLESHPEHPYYLSGGADGSVRLWQFGAPKGSALISTFRLEGPRITKIHFNKTGTKFGAANIDGSLSLWRFGQDLKPFKDIPAHKSTLDFAFLNHGSFIATAGLPFADSTSTVALWDTLLPPHRMQVAGFDAGEGGTSSLAFSARHQLLLCGSKKGDISVIDLRQRQIMTTLHAHTLNVKSLSLDECEDFFVSGSNDGDGKIWSLPALETVDSWINLHEKSTFYGKHGVFTDQISTFGVMQLQLYDSQIYSCGANGQLLWRNLYEK